MEKVNLVVSGENKGHYTSGIISQGLLFVSGQLSLNLDTREVANGGVREHMRQALTNLGRVLEAAGLSSKDVVQCRVYIVGIDNWDEINEEYAAFFGEHKPARIVVSASELHFGCLVEIEAIAECHS